MVHIAKDGRRSAWLPAVEGLEGRTLMAAGVGAKAVSFPTLTPSDVSTLLDRAAAATASKDAIIAVVDRGGNILGVRIESAVSPAITGDTEKLVFAIDGAVAKARTGAFFGNDQAPLTARTIQFISQSTLTQREIESDPNIEDPNSTLRGPGYVGPIGKKAHFPPRVQFTPQVDLFQIEHTNRDSIISPGPNHIRQDTVINGQVVPSPTGDDVLLPNRFNVPTQFLGNPANPIKAPESYGFVSQMLPSAQSRGIATLPGGIPLFKTANGQTAEVGGIGVFFPGETGFATEENSKLNEAPFHDPTKLDRSEEAEYIAFVAAGGSTSAGITVFNGKKGAARGLPPLPGFDLPSGRIDLVGITLDIFGAGGRQGIKNLVDFGLTLGTGFAKDGVNMPIAPGQVAVPATQAGNNNVGSGVTLPQGWLVLPHDAQDGSGLTAQDVTNIITRGIVEATRTRAAIRLPLDSNARMMLAVSDKSGNVLGLYRMPDATFFSIDVAVAKSRNVTYYADAAQLQPQDRVSNVPLGTAFTNRTFRYLAEPRFPEGIDINPPGPFSILNEDTLATTPATRKPASSFQTVQGFDSFNPQTNFHQPFNLNQNGIVFFPGSAPLYKTVNGVKQLVGGFGISGDGVDQDDVVTFAGSNGFSTVGTDARRADQVFVRGARLPYQKFNRQPHNPINQPKGSGTLPGGTINILPTKLSKPGTKT